MRLHLKQILGADELDTARALLGDDAPWIEGASTAGAQAQSAKRNQQLAQDSEPSARLQALVLAALQRDALFMSAALPRRIYRPLFNRYRAGGDCYGPHVDGAILHSHSSGEWVRSDLSCTLFLADPEEYDGGELVVHDGSARRGIRLAAGDALLYPGSSVHEVTPVTRGTRLASFFWIESLVRGDEQRRVLFDLDLNLLQLRARHGESAETVALSGVYHNLLRLWAST